jgi:GT2 family glycosyltransferase
MTGSDEKLSISVVVPCLNQAAELRACLAALGTQDTSSPFEVLVVDSGHDPAVVQVTEDSNVARIVRGDKGLDAAAARNVGADHASGHYLVFTDADCVPDPGFLRAAEKILSSGVRIATGPVKDADYRFIPTCDNLLQFVDFPASRPAGPAQLAPGCNLAISRQDFIALGGFGEGRAEDVRFILTAISQLPGALMYCPEMQVSHQGRSGWQAFLQHQKQFGLSRGRHELLLTPLQRRLGVYRVMIFPVALKRYSYIIRRTARWNPARLGKLVLQTPILLPGLIAWAIGFRRGLIAARQLSDD